MLTQPQHIPTRPHVGQLATSSLMAQDIEVVLDKLAASITADDNGDIFGLWAVASLASKLGLTVALSPSADPATIIQDLGDAWVAEVSRGLDDGDEARVPDVLGAAYRVIEQAVEEVRRRGLAP